MDIFAQELWPFWAAFAIILVILVAEVATGVTSHIDASLTIDVPIDSKELIGMSIGLLRWLGFGSVPAIIVIIMYAAVFAFMGMLIQSVWHDATGAFASPLLASMMAVLPAVIAGKLIVDRFRGVTSDVSESVTPGDLVGLDATIMTDTLGGAITEAKIIDRFGNTHYKLVMLPGDDDVEYFTGDVVRTVSYDEDMMVFKVARPLDLTI